MLRRSCALLPSRLASSTPRRRILCTTGNEAPPLATCFGAGLAGGGVGALVGIGGGAVMVPIMTAYAKMTQHQAVGTSSAAIAGTGLAGMLSFGAAGAVDLPAAAALASTAMLTARFGAHFTKRFDPQQLGRAFAWFQIVVAPLVPLKAELTRRSKRESATSAGNGDGNGDGGGGRRVPGFRTFLTAAASTVATAGGGGADADSPPTPFGMPDADRTRQLMLLGITGLVAGFASGMFGIGGGVILTPALCLFTEMPHACVLGTTLASMVPPSLVSAGTHRQMGNVVGTVVMPLVVGSALGAASAGQLAVRAPEEPLQWGFAIFLSASGARKLWSLRAR